MLQLVRNSRGLSRFKIATQLQIKLQQNAAFSTSQNEKPTQNQTTGPPPIRVGIVESAGRGLFSTRKIYAGDLIHTAKPVFFDMETKADWLPFDDYCRSKGLKYPFMVKRLACMVISGAVSTECLDILQPSALSHEMILEMEEGYGLLRSCFTKANIPDHQIAFLTRQWYINQLARIRLNSFRIELPVGSYEDLLSSAAACVEAEAAVGNSVYMLPSFYNHDCDPNAHIVWIENADARLKALRDIEPDEELRICYIDASMDRDARQAILLQGFGFKCNCLRCLSGD